MQHFWLLLIIHGLGSHRTSFIKSESKAKLSKMLRHSSRRQVHECSGMPILLFEHVFWTWEVTRCETYRYMKYYRVCVHVYSHILMSHGVGQGAVDNLVNSVSEGLFFDTGIQCVLSGPD